MKAFLAYSLITALACYAIGAAFGNKDQVARKLRRRDDVETLLNSATQ